MAGSGELERAVLQTLWGAQEPMTAREVCDVLTDRDLAITTVLTVLDRLGRKHLVSREKSGRANTFRAAVSREDYVAGLMLDALGQAPDRGAALARFLTGVSDTDSEHLRRGLRRRPERRTH